MPEFVRVYLLLIMPEFVCNWTRVLCTWEDCGNCVMPAG